MDAVQLIGRLEEFIKTTRNGITAPVVLQGVSGLRYEIDSLEYDIDVNEILINVGEVQS